MHDWVGEPRFLVTPLTEQPGFLSQTFEATRRGDPDTYVLKVGTRNQRAREFARKVQAFRREVGAYKLLRPFGGQVVPRCRASAFSADGSDGLLLLEKITGARTGDQVAGLTFCELSAAIRAIGRVHAHFWRQPRKKGHPLFLPRHQYNLAHEIPSSLRAFRREFSSLVSADEKTGLAKIPRIVSQAIRQAKKRPATLLHGDWRADNLLFVPGRVLIVDWQLASWGLGSFDLARLIGGSTKRPLALSEQKKLVSLWHQTLQRGGVRQYTSEEAWQDYRIGVALTLSIPITNGPVLAHLSPRGKQIARLMIRRFFCNGQELGFL